MEYYGNIILSQWGIFVCYERNMMKYTFTSLKKKTPSRLVFRFTIYGSRSFILPNLLQFPAGTVKIGHTFITRKMFHVHASGVFLRVSYAREQEGVAML